MDRKKAFDSGSQWISDEQRIHETSDYGRNQRAVNDALAEQQRRVKLVQEYSKEVENAKGAAKTTTEKDRISEGYEELKQVSEHRESCLKDIAQIASLEDIFNTLSIEFAQRASSLVVDACTEVTAVSAASTPGADDQSPGARGGSDGIARAAQSCILAVRNNWNWISKLVKCSDVHLKHVSDYHQFFHEAKEYQQWMPAELNKHIQTLEEMKPDENDDSALLKALKEILAVFLHWQNKINVLFDRSRKIVPVHYRTKTLDHYVPVTSLCDYKTNEINVQEGEELTLLDNSKPQVWLVRNMHSTESRVPSVICVIPGPDTEAVSMAMRLRLQLLKTWTVCVKQIGRVVILYFGLVIKDWDEDSVRKLQSLTDDDKMRTLQILQWILDVFSRYWKDEPHFRDLMVRIERTRTAVRGEGNPKDYDIAFSRDYISRMRTLEELLTHFRNYLKQWETYKVLAEASKQSDYMLLMRNWEELNFFSTEEVLRKVSLDLEMSSTVKKDVTDSVQVTETQIVEETIEKVETTMETNQLQEEKTVTTANFETVNQTAEAEQYLHAEQEERKKFIITGVIDPQSNEEISLDQAILLGIINQQQGIYFNTVTKKSMPIPEAMNEGKIKVEFTTVRRTQEKRSDVGLITISTERESRPYTVKAVIDAATDEELTIDQAISRGILNQKTGTVKNTLTNTEMTLADAMDTGHLIVEFDSEAPAGDVQNVTIVYAIHAVVDQREKAKISFSEAVKRGLIDKSTGAYFHNVEMKDVYVGDAIKRGFIKATVVKDPTSMDISPENKMVVEKVDLIRKKLINPLKTIAAMRGAKGDSKVEKVEGQTKRHQVVQGNGVKNEDGRRSTEQQMDEFVTDLSPRLPGDGTEHEDSKVPLKSSEEYLNQSLLQRMSSTGQQSRLEQMKQMFQKKHVEKQSSSSAEIPLVLNISNNNREGQVPASPKSPKKLSKIPRFCSSERIDGSKSEQKSTGASSKIPKHLFRSKSVSMDQLNTSNQTEAATFSMNMSQNTSMSVSNIGSSDVNCHHRYEQALQDGHTGYRNSSGTTPVLIYTEETESLIHIPRKEEARKPEMCTIGTQYEASASTASSDGISGVSTKEHSLFGYAESTARETVYNKEVSNTTTDTHTVITREKAKVGGKSSTKAVEERFGYKGSLSSKEIKGGSIDVDITDSAAAVDETMAGDQSLRYRGKGKATVQKTKSHLDAPNGSNIKLDDTSSDEETFFFAQGAKQQGQHQEGIVYTSSGFGMQKSGLHWEEKNTARRDADGNAGFRMVSKLTESISTQTEELELVQGAIAALMAKHSGDTDDDASSKPRGALCLRICKACLPLQMLMLLLLGLACLFPMSEEEYSCTLSNNFENSLAVMLKHRDGPPPV